MIDLVIIGAGPAGLSAAIQVKKNNLSVIVLDEFPLAGGRLLGQLHQEPTGEWWNGIEESEKLVSEATELGVDIQLGVSVHHIDQVENHFIIHTDGELLRSANVLIATGAAETPIPIPGWTLPGVMSIGAAQVMTNVHRVKVGLKGAIVGVNVLSAAIAHELHLGGVKVEIMAMPPRTSISDDQSVPKKVMESLSRIGHLAPSTFIQFGSKIAQKSEFVRNTAVRFFPKKGIEMFGMPIHLRKAITRINGTEKVDSITTVDLTADGEVVSNSEKTIEVDFVCIAGGLYPLAELASVMGVPFNFIEELGGHIPVHNEKMETIVEGIFVAGNITGIESAKVAMAQGKVAGIAIAKKQTKNAQLDIELDRFIQEVKNTRTNATIQFNPNINRGREKVKAAYNELINQ